MLSQKPKKTSSQKYVNKNSIKYYIEVNSRYSMVHLGSVSLSGEIILNLSVIQELTILEYNLIFTSAEINQIYLEQVEDSDHHLYNLEIPTGNHSFDLLLSKPIIIPLLLYTRAIVIQPKHQYKQLLTHVFYQWQIPCEWKRGPNYLKAIPHGSCSLSPLDLESFSSLIGGINPTTLPQIKAANAYTYAKEYFQHHMYDKLYEAENIDEEFDQAMNNLKVIYRSLAALDRIPQKSKQYSFSKLSKQIKEMFMKNNDSSDQSMQEVISEALKSLFQEEFGDRFEQSEHLSPEEFKKIAEQFFHMTGCDPKSVECLNLILIKLFDMNMRSQSAKRPKKSTQYAANKRMKQIGKKVFDYETKHNDQKQAWFKKIHESEIMLKEKDEKLLSLQNKIISLEEEKKKIEKECDQKLKKFQYEGSDVNMKKTKNVVGSIKIKTETSNSSWKSKNSQILITPKSEAGKQIEEKREMKKKQSNPPTQRIPRRTEPNKQNKKIVERKAALAPKNNIKI